MRIRQEILPKTQVLDTGRVAEVLLIIIMIRPIGIEEKFLIDYGTESFMNTNDKGKV
jgi:hypothetical protein